MGQEDAGLKYYHIEADNSVRNLSDNLIGNLSIRTGTSILLFLVVLFLAPMERHCKVSPILIYVS